MYPFVSTAKYPHLQVCTPQKEGEWGVLDFGSVPVGKTKEKYFDIFNPCQVNLSSHSKYPSVEKLEEKYRKLMKII